MVTVTTTPAEGTALHQLFNGVNIPTRITALASLKAKISPEGNTFDVEDEEGDALGIAMLLYTFDCDDPGAAGALASFSGKMAKAYVAELRGNH